MGDKDNGLQIVAIHAAETLPDCTVRESVRADHEAQGPIERWHRTLQGQYRAALLELNAVLVKLGKRKATSADTGLMHWLVRHSLWSLHRFHPLRGQQTGHAIVQGSPIRRQGVPVRRKRVAPQVGRADEGARPYSDVQASSPMGDSSVNWQIGHRRRTSGMGSRRIDLLGPSSSTIWKVRGAVA